MNVLSRKWKEIRGLGIGQLFLIETCPVSRADPNCRPGTIKHYIVVKGNKHFMI